MKNWQTAGETKFGGKLAREIWVFLACPHNMRILLITNLIYSFAMPVIYMFISTYVLRNTKSVSMVLVYQLASYTGIPFTFLINGWLLKRFQIRRLYALGMLLSGVSMTIMMLLPTLTVIGLVVAGLVMGMSFGLYWSNRDFLALSTTNNENRNYYYGLEAFFSIVIGMLVPVSVGWFLEASAHWSSSENYGYHIVTAGVFIVALVASVVVHTGKFANPPLTRFIYFSFNRIWNRFLVMAVLKGLAQGYIITAPAMLVTRFVGKEGALGTAQSVGVLFSAILIYYIGRTARPVHRVLIFSLALTLFALGGVFNAIMFDATGVYIFMLCLVLAIPLLDFAYFPIQLQVIDTVSAIENRNQFAYLFNHEFGLYLGRFAGCGLFLVLAFQMSDVVALRYSLLIIGILQLLSVIVAKNVTRACAQVEASPQPGSNHTEPLVTDINPEGIASSDSITITAK